MSDGKDVCTAKSVKPLFVFTAVLPEITVIFTSSVKIITFTRNGLQTRVAQYGHDLLSTVFGLVNIVLTVKR